MEEFEKNVKSLKRKLASSAKEVEAIFESGKAMSADPSRASTFRGMFRALEKYFSKFELTWEELVDAHEEAGKTDFPGSSDKRFLANVRDYYYQSNTMYENMIATPPPAHIVNNESFVETHTSRMPEISLPKFDGNLTFWPQFRDTFLSLIHTSNVLTTMEKFHYLATSLSDSALSVIQGIKLEEKNYEIAWKAVTDAYNNKRVLASFYLNNIMEFSSLKGKPNVDSLKLFQSRICDNISAFQLLGIEHESAFILFHLAIRHLDPRTRESFEMSHKHLEFPTHDDLKKFVRERCLALQLAEGNSSTSPTPTTFTPKPAGSDKRNQNHNKGVHKPSLGAFQNGSKSKVPLVSTQLNPPTCVLCSNGDKHLLLGCPKFYRITPEARLQGLKDFKGCRNCLSYEHKTLACTSKWNCRFCDRRHHAMLHLESVSTSSSSTSNQSGKSNTSPHLQRSLLTSVSLKSTFDGEVDVILGTVLAEFMDVRGRFQTFRVVIDSGSHYSFITERCLNKLGISYTHCPRRISGIGQSIFEGAKGKTSCTLRPRNRSSPNLTTVAMVVKDITSFLPTSTLSSDVTSQYSSYELADPTFWKSSTIDFLLGADLYGEIWTGSAVNIAEGLPKLFPSIFGHVVIGRFAQPTNTMNGVSLLAFSVPPDDLNDQLTKFWELEETSCPMPTMSDEDVECEKFFMDTHYRTPEGRYVVKLPFKSMDFALGDSSFAALKQFKALERKLQQDEETKNMYFDFISEYLSLQHMVPAASSSKFVIPHHGVTKIDRNQLKLRVVFNGSVNCHPNSLNDVLMVGPKLQKDVRKILLNFRKHAVVFVTDIVKMYRQILIDLPDRQYQHIYWRFEPREPIQTYELVTLTYGLTSSPYLALRVIQQLSIDEGEHYPLAARTLQNDIYIDDVATGANTIEEAIELRDQLISLLQKGGFQLSKWASNSPELLTSVSNTINDPITLSSEPINSIKILGLQWDPTSDCFSYTFSAPTLTCTKRAILSTIAKLYDPLGFLSPTIILMKLIMQELWKENLDWDDPIPSSIAMRWKNILEKLPDLALLKIPRFVGSCPSFQYQIVGFSDASGKAYSGSLFLRSITDSGYISVNLLIAKTKLAPVKSVSIPRLELCGVLLLSQLYQFVSQFMESLTPTPLKPAFFTDSSVVLAWLKTPQYKLKMFVANRVAEILKLTTLDSWYHVVSAENASDCSSRGIYPDVLVAHSLWWNGPAWLKTPQEHWPKPMFNEPEDVPELKPHVSLATTPIDASNDFMQLPFATILVSWMSRVSSYSKLLHSLAWLRRCCRKYFRSEPLKRNAITLTELNDVLIICIKAVQRHHFLADKESSLKSVIDKYIVLNPFLDTDGLLRVGGRLRHADLPGDHKNPILLPYDAHLTSLIVDHYHYLHLHPGPGLLQALIQTRYWVPALRRLVRQRTFHCLTCYKSRAKGSIPIMGDLPEYRLKGGRAFLHVGVDFAGPFDLKESTRRNAAIGKAYLCIFLCMSTKAVHLEAVTKLSTEAFLASLSRFTSRRGLPEAIYSDCGSNFLGASRTLREFFNWYKELDTKDSITNYSSSSGFHWHFDPPYSPHFGGLWEAGVKSVKTILPKVSGKNPLTYEEMSTLFARIEGILNSRPLCPLSSDPTETDYLSPGHFLIGCPILTVPEPSVLDLRENTLSRWQMVQRMSEQVWQRWRIEFLSTLQKRSKWHRHSENLEIGDLVVIRDSTAHPLRWPTARVIQANPGQDGCVRVVTVRTPRATYQRSVTKLVPLLPLKSDPFNRNL